MEMPAEVVPSKTRKRLLSASRRTCMGRSGNPIGKMACSGGAPRLSRSNHCQGHATEGAQRKEGPSDKDEAPRPQQACKSDKTP